MLWFDRSCNIGWDTKQFHTSLQTIIIIVHCIRNNPQSDNIFYSILRAPKRRNNVMFVNLWSSLRRSKRGLRQLKVSSIKLRIKPFHNSEKQTKGIWLYVNLFDFIQSLSVIMYCAYTLQKMKHLMRNFKVPRRGRIG